MLYQIEHATQCCLTVLHSYLVPTSCTKRLTPAWRPSRKVKPGEILSAVWHFSNYPFVPPPPPPSVTISCPQPALLHRQCERSEATGGYRRPRTAGSRELGHQNAINLGHFNLLRPAIFAWHTARTTYVAPLQ